MKLRVTWVQYVLLTTAILACGEHRIVPIDVDLDLEDGSALIVFESEKTPDPSRLRAVAVDSSSDLSGLEFLPSATDADLYRITELSFRASLADMDFAEGEIINRTTDFAPLKTLDVFPRLLRSARVREIGRDQILEQPATWPPWKETTFKDFSFALGEFGISPGAPCAQSFIAVVRPIYDQLEGCSTTAYAVRLSERSVLAATRDQRHYRIDVEGEGNTLHPVVVPLRNLIGQDSFASCLDEALPGYHGAMVGPNGDLWLGTKDGQILRAEVADVLNADADTVLKTESLFQLGPGDVVHTIAGDVSDYPDRFELLVLTTNGKFWRITQSSNPVMLHDFNLPENKTTYASSLTQLPDGRWAAACAYSDQVAFLDVRTSSTSVDVMVPSTGVGMSVLSYVPERGLVAGTDLGVLFILEDGSRQWLLEQVPKLDVNIEALLPHEDGVLVAGTNGAVAQWRDSVGYCGVREMLSDVVVRTIIPLGEDVMFAFGGKRSDDTIVPFALWALEPGS